VSSYGCAAALFSLSIGGSKIKRGMAQLTRKATELTRVMDMNNGVHTKLQPKFQKLLRSLRSMF
jgi:hypothetical protein